MIILCFIAAHFVFNFDTILCSSHLKVTAQLKECSDTVACDSSEKPSKSSEIKNDNAEISGKRPSFQGPSVLQECIRKLYIAVQINNEGKSSGDDDFVVVDDVEDPVSGNKTHLLNPIVLKLHREQVQIIYPLNFQQVVNGGVREEVIQAQNGSSINCDESMCGVTKYDGSPMPYSEGFCCSCSGLPYKETQPHLSQAARASLLEPGLFSQLVKRSADPSSNDKKSGKDKKNSIIHLTSLPCAPFHHKLINALPPNFFLTNDKIVMGDSDESGTICTVDAYNVPSQAEAGKVKHKGEVMLEQEKKEKQAYLRNPGKGLRRQKLQRNKATLSRGLFDDRVFLDPNPLYHRRKVRGLSGASRPPDSFRTRVDKERLKKVLEQTGRAKRKETRHSCSRRSDDQPTAHCLRFSDLWYSVYSFRDPVIVQELTLQVFQKRDAENGTTYWTDLTRGSVIKLGTYYPQAKDELPTIAFSYSSSLNPNGKCEGELCPIEADSHFLLIPSHVQEPASPEDHPEAKGGAGEYLVVSRGDVSADGAGCDQVGTLFEGFAEQSERCQMPEGSCLNHQPIDLWLQDMDHRVKGEPGQYFVENYGSVAASPLPSAAAAVKGHVLPLEFTAAFQSLVEVEIRADSHALVRPGWGVQIQSVTVDSSSPQRTLVEVLVVNTGLAFGQFRPWLVECSGDLPPDAVPEGPLVAIGPLQRHLFRIIMEGALPTASMTCTVEVHNTQQERIASRQVLIQKQARCLCGLHCSCSCLTSTNGLSCASLMQEEYSAAGYAGALPRRSGIPAEIPFAIVPTNVLLTALMILLLLGKFKVILGFYFKFIRAYGLDFLRGSPECCMKRCMSDAKKNVVMHRLGTEIFLNMFFFILYPLMVIWLKIIGCFSLCSDCCSPNDYDVISDYAPAPSLPPFNPSRRAPGHLSDDGGLEEDDGRYDGEVEDTQYVINTMRGLKTTARSTRKYHHTL